MGRSKPEEGRGGIAEVLFQRGPKGEQSGKFSHPIFQISSSHPPPPQ